MSRSQAFFVLIENGQQRQFSQEWGNVTRELFWGPDALWEWLDAEPEDDYFPEDLSGAAIINFDLKTLTWGQPEPVGVPRAMGSYERLLAASWPGFNIEGVGDEIGKQIYALDPDSENDDLDDDALAEYDSLDDRPSTVSDAAEDFSSEDEVDEYGELSEPFSEDFPAAWITLVDAEGEVRQRGLGAVSLDLIAAEQSALQKLHDLDAVPVPSESSVAEGLYIDLPSKRLMFWGHYSELVAERLRYHWNGFQVTTSSEGYLKQCELAGVSGKPMSEAQLIASFMQQVESTDGTSMKEVIDAIGGSLKSSAIKATGCLTLVLILPILLVGYFMSMWKEAGYAILTLIVIVIAVFKFVELKIKSKFQNSPFAHRANEETGEGRPPAAGPLEEAERKRAINQSLSTCGMPALKEIETHYEDYDFE